MTEPGSTDPIHPAPASPPERARIDGPPSRRRRDFLPLLYVLGFLVLGGSLFYLYRHPGVPASVIQDAARVDTLQQQLQSIGDRLTQLEQRPAPSPPNLGPLETRIAALEQRPASLPAVPPAPPVNLGPLSSRLDGVASRLDGAAAKQGSDMAALAARLDTLDGRVAAAEKQGATVAGQLGAVTDRSQRVTRIQAAATALETGRKLGDIPGAPPALTRFANDAPPTEAALRLSFATAAEAAQRASQPAIMDDKPFATRLWTRAQQSVTVRQGDRVLLGDPIAGVLTHARETLDAGDLAGTIAVLDGLAGPAAQAMAGWTGQARALLDARAALATMARS